jgi:predicted AAA+ superfamily ATPase
MKQNLCYYWDKQNAIIEKETFDCEYLVVYQMKESEEEKKRRICEEEDLKNVKIKLIKRDIVGIIVKEGLDHIALKLTIQN